MEVGTRWDGRERKIDRDMRIGWMMMMHGCEMAEMQFVAGKRRNANTTYTKSI